VHAVHDSIITMDGDGQNDSRDIEGLLQTLKQAPRPAMTLVKGFRRSRRDSAWRRFSSLLANGVRRRLLGDATPDSGCGIQALSRELFLSLPWFDHMHRFLPALVLRAGGEVISREVNHRERSRGHSHYGTLDRLAAGLIDLAGVLWLMRRAPVPHIEEPHDYWNNRHLLAGDRFSGPGTVHGEIPGPMAAK
jgi:dolichol-phosphate mannosyltransferase